MKSDKWVLERFKFGGQHYLNIGDTTIGRNKNANIITRSDICSRQHCVITLNSDDTVYLVNQVRPMFLVNFCAIPIVFCLLNIVF